MALLDHQEQSSEPERSTAVDQWMAQCSKCGLIKVASNDRSVTEFTIEQRSGRARAECKKCNAKRRREYVARIKTQPRKYAEFKRKENEAVARWHKAHPEATAAANQKFKERHPERYYEQQRKGSKLYRQRLREDPVRYQAYIENRRINYRLKRERETGQLERVSKGHAHSFAERRRSRVNTKPFADWFRVVLKEKGISPADVARLVGIDPSGLAKIAYGDYRTMDISIADKVLTLLSGPPLRSLYPDA